jgi:hypothetical protein
MQIFVLGADSIFPKNLDITLPRHSVMVFIGLINFSVFFRKNQA